MARRTSLRGKKVLVVSSSSSSEDDDVDIDRNIIKYIKPISVYNDLEVRSINNPYFLRRCLNYIIKAKKKRRSNSDGTIVFNYRDLRNRKTLKAQIVKKFSCPFCTRPFGGHEGLRLHLKSSHDAFEYKFYRAEKDGGPEVDVSLKCDTIRFGVLKDDVGDPQLNPFVFCSKRRKKRSQRDDKKNVKRLNISFLELDLKDLPPPTKTESTHVKDGNVVSSRPKLARSAKKTSVILTKTKPAKAESSKPASVPHVSKRKQLFAERLKAKRIERLKSRQFFHSQTMQPMSVEQVMSNEDSENEADDDTLDLFERLKLERIVDASADVKRYMYLWNIFVRKQRVIADGHVPWACEEFTKLHKEELKTSSSFDWWWRIFRIKLWKHGLICAKTFHNCTIIFRNSEEGPSTSQGASNANKQPMEVDAGPSTSRGASNANEQPMEIDAEQQ